jgi:hypothetical protein
MNFNITVSDSVDFYPDSVADLSALKVILPKKYPFS